MAKKNSNTEVPATSDASPLGDDMTAADRRVMAMVEAVLEKTLVKVVPEVIIAAQRVGTQQNALQTRMAAEREMKKLQSCSCCRQRVIACGGVWRKATAEQIADGAKVDAEGYLLKEQGGREEFPDDNHIKIVVWPADPAGEKFFAGVCITGIWYRSQGPDHRVYVPRNNDIAWTVANFAKNERDQMTGKTHQHNSGGIHSFTPAGSDGASFR